MMIKSQQQHNVSLVFLRYGAFILKPETQSQDGCGEWSRLVSQICVIVVASRVFSPHHVTNIILFFTCIVFGSAQKC